VDPVRFAVFSATIGDATAHDPVVFISSTSEDLKEHREQAAKAALASGFSPRMMEYFPASGQAPTEWERAARGRQGGRYPWGDEAPLDASRANYIGVLGHLAPVGLFPCGSTSETLCDMLANAWEWCGDWLGPYKAGDRENPTGPRDGKYKVLHGGSCYNNPLLVRVSIRYGFDPTKRSSDTGFRCAGD
jgi:hypothetical protein